MSSIQQPLTFLTLPSEIRLIIYRYLAKETLIAVERISSRDVNDNNAHRSWPYTINLQGLDILATCRRVYHEAAPVFLPVTALSIPSRAMIYDALPHESFTTLMRRNLGKIMVFDDWYYCHGADYAVYGHESSSEIELYPPATVTMFNFERWFHNVDKFVEMLMPPTLQRSLLEADVRSRFDHIPSLSRDERLELDKVSVTGPYRTCKTTTSFLRRVFPSHKIIVVLHCYIKWSAMDRDVILLELFCDVSERKLNNKKIWNQETGKELVTKADIRALLEATAPESGLTDIQASPERTQARRPPGKREYFQ